MSADGMPDAMRRWAAERAKQVFPQYVASHTAPGPPGAPNAWASEHAPGGCFEGGTYVGRTTSSRTMMAFLRASVERLLARPGLRPLARLRAMRPGHGGARPRAGMGVVVTGNPCFPAEMDPRSNMMRSTQSPGAGDRGLVLYLVL